MPTEWNEVEEMALKKGLSPAQFWDGQDDEFWSTLPMYDYSKGFISKLESVVGKENICLLTSPTLTSAGGTQQWIRNCLPDYFDSKQYLIGPAKYMVAGPGKLLIDDNDGHFEEFVKHGGDAILFPQPWNQKRGLEGVNVQHTLELLDCFIGIEEGRYGKYYNDRDSYLYN
jgi:hypothetical protein